MIILLLLLLYYLFNPSSDNGIRFQINGITNIIIIIWYYLNLYYTEILGRL